MPCPLKPKEMPRFLYQFAIFFAQGTVFFEVTIKDDHAKNLLQHIAQQRFDKACSSISIANQQRETYPKGVWR